MSPVNSIHGTPREKPPRLQKHAREQCMGPTGKSHHSHRNTLVNSARDPPEKATTTTETRFQKKKPQTNNQYPNGY